MKSYKEFPGKFPNISFRTAIKARKLETRIVTQRNINIYVAQRITQQTKQNIYLKKYQIRQKGLSYPQKTIIKS